MMAMRDQAGDDEFGGLQEVAAWLGVLLSAVKTLRYRHHRPPKPPWRSFREIEDPSSTPGRPRYRRSVVEQWARDTGRLLPESRQPQAKPGSIASASVST